MLSGFVLEAELSWAASRVCEGKGNAHRRKQTEGREVGQNRDGTCRIRVWFPQDTSREPTGSLSGGDGEHTGSVSLAASQEGTGAP